jgi:hypothetical protein
MAYSKSVLVDVTEITITPERLERLLDDAYLAGDAADRRVDYNGWWDKRIKVTKGVVERLVQE